MHLNTERLRNDMKATAAKLHDLKRVIRESGQPRVSWRTYADLHKLKHHATQMCSLRAHIRGRLHRPKVMDSAKQAEYIANLLPLYALEA